MRKKRIQFGQKTAYYHLMSRTVDGAALFGAREREVLRKMIWQVADFSGVRVVTYAVMKNHFHLLVEVPPEGTEISDEELVRRFTVLYPQPTPWQPMRADVLRKHLRDSSAEGKYLRQMLTRRMHNVSFLMKTLKQRFSMWLNRSRDRFGPVWADRFKSVLVEGDQWALRTVAAYIDLNAVRAGIVEDPKDYRFCGYGEAVAGVQVARAGLSIASGSLSHYRETLYGFGSEPKEGKASFDREAAVRVLEKEKGNLPLSQILRCRIRYFSDGKILGSKEFVESHLKGTTPAMSQSKHAHPMHGSEWGGLSVAQGLRKDLFG